MFKKLFGSSSASEPLKQPGSTTANKTIGAIQNLNDHEETLEKRKALLEKRIEVELAKAQDFLRAKRKPQALQCMKKKKMLEAEIANLDNMMMRVTEQKNQLESMRTTVDVVSAMHKASQISKQMLKETNIENVEKVMEDIGETNEQIRTINDAFQQSAGGVDLDEDELLAELEGMEEQQLEEDLMTPAPIPTSRVAAPAAKMPSVPQRAAPKKTAEELELEALEAEMSLA
ncbi:MAG: hypothetical protein WDW38_005962 [Sanguina aurantia]